MEGFVSGLSVGRSNLWSMSFQVDTSGLNTPLQVGETGSIRVYLDDSSDSGTTFHIDSGAGVSLDQSGDISLSYGSDVTINVTAESTSDANFTITDTDYSYDNTTYVTVWTISGVAFDSSSKHIGDDLTVSGTYDDGGAGLSTAAYLTDGVNTKGVGIPGTFTLNTYDDSTPLNPGTYELHLHFLDSGKDYDLGLNLTIVPLALGRPRITLSVDHTKVGSGGVSNFSVLITRASFGTAGNAMFFGGSSAQTDGGDLRFTSDASGLNQLPCDVIAFNHDSSGGAADSTCQIRVNLSLSSSSNTIFYCWYYPAGGQSQPSVSSTYGQYNAYDSNFSLVLPLEETSGTIHDRTVNQNVCTVGGALTYGATGQVGKGASFNGSDTHIDVTDAPSLTSSSFTIEFWTKITNTGILICKRNSSNNYPYQLFYNTGTIQFYTNNSGSEPDVMTSVSTGVWVHNVNVYNGSTLNVYYNGVADGSSPHTIAAGSTNSSQVIIGALFLGSYTGFFNGVLDDLKLHNTARSAAWILTEYNQSNSPSTFITATAQSKFRRSSSRRSGSRCANQT